LGAGAESCVRTRTSGGETVTVEKAFPSGAWRISDIVRGVLVTRVYFDYTKKEAVALFKEEMKQL